MQAPPEMRAPGHGFAPDIDEPDTGTPSFDRLSRDASPLAQMALQAASDVQKPDARERIATRFYNRLLGNDGVRTAAQYAVDLQQVETVHGAASDEMEESLLDLAGTLAAMGDTELAHKLRDTYTAFHTRYLDATGRADATRAEVAMVAQDALQPDQSAVPQLPPPQSGRGELTPSVVAMAAQNMADNPLAAQMHARRLLSTSQAADATQMSHLQYTLERQQQLGPGRVRRRRGPVRTDWSKKKPHRV